MHTDDPNGDAPLVPMIGTPDEPRIDPDRLRREIDALRARIDRLEEALEGRR